MNTPEVFFHTNYSRVQGQEYAKVSVKTDYGVFAIIVNKRTGDSQRQAYTLKKPAAKVVYMGNNYAGLYKGFKSLAAGWNVITDNDKEYLNRCWYRLVGAFYLLAYKGTSDGTINQAQKMELQNWLVQLRRMTLEDVVQKTLANAPDAPQDAFAGGATSTPVAPVAAPTVAEWGSVQTAALSQNDLNAIINAINEQQNPVEGIEFGGKRYRIAISDTTGFPEILCKTDAAPVATSVAPVAPVATSTPAPEIRKPTRKTERMVEITNCEGLTEFVKGSLYRLLANANMDGLNFYKVANDAGEERFIRANRGRLVEVFAEPPKADETAIATA